MTSTTSIAERISTMVASLEEPLYHRISEAVATRLEKKIADEFAALRTTLEDHALQVELSANEDGSFEYEDHANSPDDLRRLLQQENQ